VKLIFTAVEGTDCAKPLQSLAEAQCVHLTFPICAVNNHHHTNSLTGSEMR